MLAARKRPASVEGGVGAGDLEARKKPRPPFLHKVGGTDADALALEAATRAPDSLNIPLQSNGHEMIEKGMAQRGNGPDTAMDVMEEAQQADLPDLPAPSDSSASPAVVRSESPVHSLPSPNAPVTISTHTVLNTENLDKSRNGRILFQTTDKPDGPAQDANGIKSTPTMHAASATTPAPPALIPFADSFATALSGASSILRRASPADEDHRRKGGMAGTSNGMLGGLPPWKVNGHGHHGAHATHPVAVEDEKDVRIRELEATDRHNRSLVAHLRAQAAHPIQHALAASSAAQHTVELAHLKEENERLRSEVAGLGALLRRVGTWGEDSVRRLRKRAERLEGELSEMRDLVEMQVRAGSFKGAVANGFMHATPLKMETGGAVDPDAVAAMLSLRSATPAVSRAQTPARIRSPDGYRDDVHMNIAAHDQDPDPAELALVVERRISEATLRVAEDGPECGRAEYEDRAREALRLTHVADGYVHAGDDSAVWGAVKPAFDGLPQIPSTGPLVVPTTPRRPVPGSVEVRPSDPLTEPRESKAVVSLPPMGWFDPVDEGVELRGGMKVTPRRRGVGMTREERLAVEVLDGLSPVGKTWRGGSHEADDEGDEEVGAEDAQDGVADGDDGEDQEPGIATRALRARTSLRSSRQARSESDGENEEDEEGDADIDGDGDREPSGEPADGGDYSMDAPAGSDDDGGSVASDDDDFRPPGSARRTSSTPAKKPVAPATLDRNVFECKKCGLRARNRKVLTIHQSKGGCAAKGEQKRAFWCERCGVSFTRAHDLKRHNKRKHDGYNAYGRRDS